MSAQINLHEEILDHLNRTVLDAAAFFATAEESLFDGHQSAHGVLSQLVFWHEQYVAVVQALLDKRMPQLKAGSFGRLNQVARSHYSSDSMTMLAYDLSCLQKEFDAILRRLPDWSINFPIKNDSPPCPLNERLLEIDTHIRQHVLRLKRSR